MTSVSAHWAATNRDFIFGLLAQISCRADAFDHYIDMPASCVVKDLTDSENEEVEQTREASDSGAMKRPSVGNLATCNAIEISKFFLLVWHPKI